MWTACEQPQEIARLHLRMKEKERTGARTVRVLHVSLLSSGAIPAVD